MPDFLDRLGEELQRAAGTPGAETPESERAPSRSRRSPRPRRRGALHRRSRWLLAGALVALAGAAGASIAGNGKPNPGPAPPLAGGNLATAADAPDLALFAILRREQTQADQIPAQSPVSLSGASGANLGLARRAQGWGRQRAWIVPGRGALCLIAQWPASGGAGASCAADAAAAAGQLLVVSGGSRAPGLQFLAGLVPDGVMAVTIHLRGRGSRAIPVHEGVYMAEVAGSAELITFTGPHGSVRVEGIALPVGSRSGGR